MIGRARRLFPPSVLAIVVVGGAVPALAQKPADAPRGATAQCNDGTFSSTKGLQGACAGHGGVKLWWGAGSVASPPPTPPMKTPAKATSSKKSAASEQPVAPPRERPTAKCNDGTYTFEKNRDKACLRKGGIDEWLRDGDPKR
jgi:hypothetical protein